MGITGRLTFTVVSSWVLAPGPAGAMATAGADIASMTMAEAATTDAAVMKLSTAIMSTATTIVATADRMADLTAAKCMVDLTAEKCTTVKCTADPMAEKCMVDRMVVANIVVAANITGNL